MSLAIFILVIVAVFCFAVWGIERLMGGSNPYVSATPRRIIEGICALTAAALIAHRSGLFGR